MKALLWKTLLLIAVDFCFITNSVFAQKQTDITRLIISDARINKVDVTASYLKNNAYFILYSNTGDSTVYFGNIWPNSKSQSYGKIYDIIQTTSEETETTYSTKTFSFKWSYIDSYDSKKGTATVKLTLIGKPAGIAFTLYMITETLDVSEYKGYMDGTLLPLK